MRVLLVYPNARREIIGWGDLGAIAEPLALEYLAAGARQDSHEVEILDLRLHGDELESTLMRLQPDVVGVTGYSMHVLRNLEICRTVKKTLPNCRTVVGGHHATLLPVDFFEPQIEYVVTGEGVAPFRQLLDNLQKGREDSPTPGVWSRRGERFDYGGDEAPFDVDDIPLPDRTLTAMDRPKYYLDFIKSIALVRNSVGCPFRCSFCSLWTIMSGKYHKRHMDAVVEELAGIKEDHVFLVDDEAFVDSGHMLELARKIQEAGVEKAYSTYCRIDTMLRKPEVIEEWRDIGLDRLFFGIEATTKEELDDYNKRLEIAQIEEGLQVAADIGIDAFTGIIVHPRYTRANFDHLRGFIDDNKIRYPSFTVWTPLPGTSADFDEVVELQPNGRPNWELFDLQHAVIETSLPVDEFMEEFHSLRAYEKAPEDSRRLA